MLRTLLVLVVASLLSACASRLSVIDPASPDDATASVQPMTAYVQHGRALKLVLIHGMGDHEPGFALGRGNVQGWLTDSFLEGLGMKPSGPIRTFPRIHTRDFADEANEIDPCSFVTLQTRPFRFASSDSGKVDVEAIEITWSALTQWVKARQLGYDLASPLAPVDGNPCLQSDRTMRIPERQYLNRALKEDLLDRRLSDVLLYSGSYGKLIQQGFAAALCQALTGQEAGRCKWPSSAPEATYVFVTHSLGSRIVYDTLLDLNGLTCRSKNAFLALERTELSNARTFAAGVVAQTAAVYMLANQLPLLGLVHFGTRLLSSDPPSPSIASTSSETAVASAAKLGLGCGNELAAFAMLRSGLQEKKTALNVVAFNDTNDILSWAIPRWYVRTPSGAAYPGISVRNVFVSNATHWFGLLESPEAAHLDYFRNHCVLLAMRKGGATGDVCQ